MRSNGRLADIQLYFKSDVELFVQTPIVVLETALFVLWLQMWQSFPSVPCTQYACLPWVGWQGDCLFNYGGLRFGYRFRRLPRRNRFQSGTDSIFPWLLLSYLQYEDHFIGSIICNLCMQQFCLGRNQKRTRMVLTRQTFSTRQICTHKKSHKKTIHVLQNDSLSSLYIQTTLFHLLFSSYLLLIVRFIKITLIFTQMAQRVVGIFLKILVLVIGLTLLFLFLQQDWLQLTIIIPSS